MRITLPPWFQIKLLHYLALTTYFFFFKFIKNNKNDVKGIIKINNAVIVTEIKSIDSC